MESLEPTQDLLVSLLASWQLVQCTVLLKIFVEEEPEGDLIDLATEPWKTQRKTTSWHPQKSEETWVPTQADTG